MLSRAQPRNSFIIDDEVKKQSLIDGIGSRSKADRSKMSDAVGLLDKAEYEAAAVVNEIRWETIQQVFIQQFEGALRVFL